MDGRITKDVYVGGGMLTLGADTVVGGDLVYSSENDPRFVGEATVSGQVRQFEPEAWRQARGIRSQDVERIGKGVFKGVQAGFRVWSYFASLLVGCVLIFFLPKPSREIADLVTKQFMASLGWGLLILILAGPALLLLSLTVISIPLAVILGMLLLIDLYIAKLFVAMSIGFWLQNRFGWSWSSYVSFGVGLTVFYLLHSLPYIGFLTWLLALLLGVGATFQYKKMAWKKR